MIADYLCANFRPVLERSSVWVGPSRDVLCVKRILIVFLCFTHHGTLRLPTFVTDGKEFISFTFQHQFHLQRSRIEKWAVKKSVNPAFNINPTWTVNIGALSLVYVEREKKIKARLFRGWVWEADGNAAQWWRKPEISYSSALFFTCRVRCVWESSALPLCSSLLHYV